VKCLTRDELNRFMKEREKILPDRIRVWIDIASNLQAVLGA
jgi:hypothetical protein